MNRFKHHWYNIPGSVRKPLVLIIGSLVIVAGMVMWFVPGPGWGAIFLGLAILATEFDRADRLKQYLIKKFKSAASAVKERAKR